MPAISFPQILAVAKGANYSFPVKFPGIDIKTLLSSSGFKFTQNGNNLFNLVNGSAIVYTLASSTSVDDSKLVYNTGGNLVDTSIFYMNGRSLGNFLFFHRHGSNETGATYSWLPQQGLKITSGTPPSGVSVHINRALLTDARISSHNVIMNDTTSGTAVGYFLWGDVCNITSYFRGYAENFDITNREQTSGYSFFVGYRYAHTQSGIDPNFPVCIGDKNGFGFMPIRQGATFNSTTNKWENGTYNWHAVVIAYDDTLISARILKIADTGISAFSEVKLKVNFTNNTSFAKTSGTFTWWVNDMVTPLITKTWDQISTDTGYNLANITAVAETYGNAMYNAAIAMRGAFIQNDGTPAPNTIIYPVPNSLIIKEFATIRVLPGGTAGLSATLSTGVNTVNLTGASTKVAFGQRLFTNTGSTGSFNTTAQNGALLTSNQRGVFVGTVSANSFTVVNSEGTAVNHSTAGLINFDAGLKHAYNNFEDTNTEITTTETQYHNTGVQLLKKLK